jgi:putative SOS response-associated peptidase YedK
MFTWEELYTLMNLSSGAAPLAIKPRYNVAPTQEAPVVRQRRGVREAAMMRWGLVPYWAKDLSFGNGRINARSEDAASKPAYREAAKRRRCLVPASGFYEWQPVEGRRAKQPWYFTPRQGPLFAFAGLWESWGTKETGRVETFTILTRPANELVKAVHDRMPVIVRALDYDRWLDEGVTDLDSLREVMEPLESGAMEARTVSTRVNRPENDDAGLVEPAVPEAGEERAATGGAGGGAEEGTLWGSTGQPDAAREERRDRTPEATDPPST